MSEQLTQERLAELRRVARAATPGPWETTEFAGAEARSEGELGVFAPRHSGSYQKPDGTWHGIVICRGMDGPTKEANVEYIAAFDPPTVLALLAEIERLRREISVQQTELENFRSALVAEGHEPGCPVVWGHSVDCVPGTCIETRIYRATYGEKGGAGE